MKEESYFSKESIQYFRSYKNQRKLLIDCFSFFVYGKNNQVQLCGTKYYFRVQGWFFIKYRQTRRQKYISSSKFFFKEEVVSFEEVFETAPEEIKQQLIFHLNLFKEC